MKLKNESGQALLIAAFIFIVMIIAIPAIVFTNRVSTRHGVSVTAKTKGSTVAQEGLAFALVQLSSAPTLTTADQLTPGGQTGAPVIPSPIDPADDVGFFVSQTVPLIMYPGEQAFASVSFLNLMATPWTDGAYQLRARNPTTNTDWSTTTLGLNAGESIPQSSTKTFIIPIMARTASGVYQFQWGLENIGTGVSFAQFSPNVNVRVAPAPPTPPNWPYLQSPSFIPSGGTYTSSQGGRYSITYTRSPTGGLQPYQVGVLVTTLDEQGQPVPGGKLYAQVSLKTASAKLPTGTTASAALQLGAPPTYGGGNIEVYWGPVVSYFESLYTLNTWMDTNRTPRKFSANSITGTTYIRSENFLRTRSDQKEYWADADLGAPATIDLGYYRAKARTTSVPGGSGPGSLPNGWSCAPTANDCKHLNDTGYFFIGAGSTLTVNGAAGDWDPGWSPPNENVLYFDGGMNGTEGGNVNFENVRIDLKNKGAIIVTGNMVIGNRQEDSGLILSNVPVPVTANLEIPYVIGTWPCRNYAGALCGDMNTPWGIASNLRPSIRGFVYVMGNMRVVPHITNTNPNLTTIVGTLQVDGPLTLNPASPANLSIYMDAEINHSIRTTEFDVQVDSLTVIP